MRWIDYLLAIIQIGYQKVQYETNSSTNWIITLQYCIIQSYETEFQFISTNCSAIQIVWKRKQSSFRSDTILPLVDVVCQSITFKGLYVYVLKTKTRSKISQKHVLAVFLLSEELSVLSYAYNQLICQL